MNQLHLSGVGEIERRHNNNSNTLVFILPSNARVHIEPVVYIQRLYIIMYSHIYTHTRVLPFPIPLPLLSTIEYTGYEGSPNESAAPLRCWRDREKTQ